MLFDLEGKSIKNVTFRTCHFHIKYFEDKNKPVGTQQLNIKKLTFRNCNFAGSFLGGIGYINCRFIDCSFSRCDFESSLFSGCTLENCNFVHCTAWNISFVETSIDPKAFLSGIFLPIENFNGISDGGEGYIRAQGKHKKTMFEISEQLVKSLTNTLHSSYFDNALYYAKYYENRLGFEKVRNASRYDAIGQGKLVKVSLRAKDAVLLTAGWISLIVTRGGTSLWRLLAILVTFVLLVFPIFTSFHNDVKYHGVSRAIAP